MTARHLAPLAAALLAAGCATESRPPAADSTVAAPVSPAVAPATIDTPATTPRAADSARARPVAPPATPRPTSAKPAAPPAKIAVGDSVGQRVIGRDSAMEWPVGGRPGRTLPSAPPPKKQTP